MLKHITNGGISTRGTRQESSIIMEPRLDQGPHRYRSPNANSSRISQQYPLNVSQLHSTNMDTSKHSIYSNTVLPPGNKALNGGLNISRVRNQSTVNKFIAKSKEVGVKEMLVSLGLLCLVSLLLALLSLIFLLKISPVTANDIRELLRSEQLTVITAEEYVVVYEVTLALCALTLSLNLCCLLVCAIQFLFAVKLVKSPQGGSDRTCLAYWGISLPRFMVDGSTNNHAAPKMAYGVSNKAYHQEHTLAEGPRSMAVAIYIDGDNTMSFVEDIQITNLSAVFHINKTNKYLQKSSVSRVCAVGGFFISIPVFLTGIILYTFIQFHSTPAIVTSVFIGLGILFCGCAMVHNVFIWQREKTNAVKELALQQHESSQHHNSFHSLTSPPTTQLNHSHVSTFNHSFGHPIAAVHNGPYIVRPSTTTPPTGESLNLTKMSHYREASGSISPGMPTVTMDLSSVATTNSPHELSTLV